MDVGIDRDGLELAFRVILSCETPEGEEQERKVFELLDAMRAGDVLDYGRILAIYQPNENVVLRRLHDYSAFMADADAAQFVVTAEHVIKHFASTYHLNQVVAQKLRDSYKRVLHIPSWFVGHLILPAEITGVHGDIAEARYDYRGGDVRLLSLFAPPPFHPTVGEVWGIHFSHLLRRMDSGEQALTRTLVEANPLTDEFLGLVDAIDYADFQRHGDYCAMSRARFNTYYG